jgi:hypothetical protein
MIGIDPERSLETALQAKWQCRIGPMGERFRVWRDEAVRCRTMRDAGESGASESLVRRENREAALQT